jgi:rRNA processing protein Krr1/Pno1
MFRKTAEESVRKINIPHKRRSYIKIRDNEIKGIIEEKIISYGRMATYKVSPV